MSPLSWGVWRSVLRGAGKGRAGEGAVRRGAFKEEVA